MCLLLPLRPASSGQSHFFSLTLLVFPALKEAQVTLSVEAALGWAEETHVLITGPLLSAMGSQEDNFSMALSPLL